jgi:hypothetical protein
MASLPIKVIGTLSGFGIFYVTLSFIHKQTMMSEKYCNKEFSSYYQTGAREGGETLKACMRRNQQLGNLYGDKPKANVNFF